MEEIKAVQRVKRISFRFLQSESWQLPVFWVSIIFALGFLFFQLHSNKVDREALRPHMEFIELLQLAKDGDYARAAQGFEDFAAKYPDNYLVPQAHARRAVAIAEMVKADHDYSSRAADFESSVAAAAKATAPAKEIVEAHLEMSTALAALQQYPEALIQCDKAMALLGKEDADLRSAVRDRMAKLLVDYGDVAPEAVLTEIGRRIFDAADADQRAQLELARGHVLRRSGKFDDAQAAYDRVLQILPGSLPAAEARYWQGRVLFDNKQYPDAYTTFIYAGKLLGRMKPADEAALLAAECLFRMENYPAAAAAFQNSAYNFADTDAGKAAQLRAGDSLLRAGKLTDAAAAYYKAFEASPFEELHANPWVDLDQSIAELETVIERTLAAEDYSTAYELLKPPATFAGPRDRFVQQSGLALLGMAEKSADPSQKRNLYLSAAAMFKTVYEDLRSADYASDALWNAAEALYNAGEYAAATDTYRRFVESKWDDPRASQAIYKRGLCYEKLGLHDAAIHVFELNETLFPFVIYSYESRLEKGLCYLAKDQPDEAKKVFAGILEDPKFSPESKVWQDALFGLGEALASQGSSDEAVAALREALDRYPNDPRAPQTRRILAGTLMAMSRYSEAIIELRQLASGPPPTSENVQRTTEAYLLLGDCYYTLQDYRNALDAYEGAVRYAGKAQEAGWALFQIANCYHSLGEQQSAAAAYRRAKLVVSSLPDDTFAAAPEGLRKKFWEELLSWASSSTAGG